jgi:hypothetical protein
MLTTIKNTNHRDSTTQIEDSYNFINYACKYTMIVIGTIILTCIVNTTYGQLCSFRIDNIFYSLAMSGSPICKTLSKTSYFLNGFVDTLFLGLI